MKFSCLVVLFALVVLLIISGCSGLTFQRVSQFDVELIDIGFRRNTVPFSPDILSLPEESLCFEVDVVPKSAFTGEPFRTVVLGNQTLILSTPSVWLVLLSRDGHFFCSQGPLTWTPEELQLPDVSERDYYEIQSTRGRRVKHIQMFVSSSDKAAVALLWDSNELAEELQRKQWEYLVAGDWLLGGDLPREADEGYIRKEFGQLFNKYFRLVVVDSDGLQKVRDLEVK